MPSCDNCPYPTKSCPSEGPEDADLLIIGESPGKNEVLNNRPFSGSSGDLLNQSLSQADIDRSEAFITNTIGCRIPNNESPSQEAIEACGSRREERISKVDPDVILSLGATASKVILDTDKGINELRGKAYQKDGRWVVPTFHPANLFHGEDCYIDFHNDIQKSKKILNDEQDFPDRDYVNLGVVDNLTKLKKSVEYIADYDVVSADLETTGLDYTTCDILAWGIGIEAHRVFVFDWRAIDKELEAIRVLNRFFQEDRSPELIWHNAQYDTKVLNYGYDMNIPCGYDTKYLHRMTDERQFDRGQGRRTLESLCQENYNWGPWDDKVDYKNMSQVDKDDLFHYLGIDCRGTYLLWRDFWNQIKEGL